ncbi:MAG: tetratricopeptide repeat protein [Bryobacteraceae bacterium]
MRSSTSNLRTVLTCAAIILLSQHLIAAQNTNEKIFGEGTESLRRGDNAAAEKAFLTVLKSEPNNLAALGNLGIVYVRTNRPAKAIDTYERALKLAPQEKGLLLNLGLAYFKQEQYTRAFPKFQQVKALDPANLQARELAASCQLFSGHVEEAISELEALRPIDPNKGGILYLLGVAYTRAKQSDKAKSIFEELFLGAINPTQTAFLMARINYEGGHFPEAESFLHDVLKNDPTFPGARLALAKVYISEREDTKALEELRLLLAEDPNDPDANYFLGALLVKEEKFAEAIPLLEAARKSLPDSWAVNYYLGKAKFKLGNTADAIALLQEASKLNPDEESVPYLLSQIYRAVGRTAEANTALARVRTLKVNALKKEEVITERIPGTQPAH